MKQKTLFFLAMLAAMSSCEELIQEDTTSPDGSLPYITITSPLDNAIFSNQQNIRIKSEITDKDKIQQLAVHVTSSDGTNGDVWGFTKSPNKNPVVVDTTFSVAALTSGNYTITLNTTDGRTNVATKMIRFSIR